MSKFIDKLKLVSQVMPVPIGFRTGPLAEQRRMLLVANVIHARTGELSELLTGADAAILSVSESPLGPKAFAKIRETASDIPWGLRLKEVGEEIIKRLKSTDACDFMIFSSDSGVSGMLDHENSGKIMELEASLAEGLLRAADKLPVDAVFLPGRDSRPLVWRDLMLFQQFASALSKPLIVSIPPDIDARELRAVWSAGVDAVIVDTDELEMGRLKHLRQVIDKLPKQRQEKKADRLLASLGSMRGAIPEQEVQEEEEEEE